MVPRNKTFTKKYSTERISNSSSNYGRGVYWHPLWFATDVSTTCFRSNVAKQASRGVPPLPRYIGGGGVAMH